MTPDFASIPDELTTRHQWAVWRSQYRGGRLTKPPYCPTTGRLASVNDPGTWASSTEACSVLASGQYTGLAFMLTASDPFTGLDLDHAVEAPGQLAVWARAIVDHFASYTEWSPSRSGLHIWIRASLPGPRRRKHLVELYDALRSLTVTGWHLEGTPRTIEARQPELEAFYQHLFPSEEPRQARTAQPQVPTNLSDTDLLARAIRARNGAHFARLWQGNACDYARPDGTLDWSRADLALCGMLAFWCAGDPARIDRLFRQSGLMRPKWDEPRGALTYGERTIARAIAGRRGNDVLPSAQERASVSPVPVRK